MDRINPPNSLLANLMYQAEDTRNRTVPFTMWCPLLTFFFTFPLLLPKLQSLTVFFPIQHKMISDPLHAMIYASAFSQEKVHHYFIGCRSQELMNSTNTPINYWKAIPKCNNNKLEMA